MTALLIAVSGDYEPYDDAHVPPVGGGDKTITGTLQTWVTIEDLPVILEGQPFPTNCPICAADCYAGATGPVSDLVAIEDDAGTLTPITRETDLGDDGAHAENGIVVVGQDFVFEVMAE